MIGKLLYLILMPLVYKLIQMFILRNDYCKDSLMKHGLTLGFYYIVEVIFVAVHYLLTKEFVFANNLKYEVGSFAMFVLLSLAFTIIHLFILGFDGEQSCIHCLVLMILFLMFLFFDSLLLGKEIDEQTFNEMPYEFVSEETINLEAFSDTHTTTGDIHGGRYYLNGQIRDNYEVYYSFLDERGSLIIRSFVYNEAHCDIFPEEDCPNPTIKITTYSKSYKDMTSTYSDYVLHIPKNETFGTGINME